MKKYRCLLNGRNFLIRRNGVTAKHGFFQHLIVEANHPQQAERLAMARVWHDEELAQMTHNSNKDKPGLYMTTLWELEVAVDLHDQESERTFYLEPVWWRFWERNKERKKLAGFFTECANPSNGET